MSPTATSRTMRAMETARDAGRIMGSTLGRLGTRAFWRSLRGGGWQRPDAVASLALGMLLILCIVTASVLLSVDFGADASERRDDDDIGEAIGARGVLTLGVNPILKAKKLTDDGKHSEAVTVLKAALVDAPKDPEIHRAMGEALEAAGKWTDAVASYEEAIRLRPELRTDEALIATALSRLDGGEDAKEAKVAKAFLEGAIGEPAVPALREALLRSHDAVIRLKGPWPTSAKAKEMITAEMQKELDRERNVRLNARRALEEICAKLKAAKGEASGKDKDTRCGPSLEALGSGGVDIVPMVLDELRDKTLCPEIKAYVTKLQKLGDPRALPLLRELDAKGYPPKGGNACLKTIVPATITALTPK